MLSPGLSASDVELLVIWLRQFSGCEVTPPLPIHTGLFRGGYCVPPTLGMGGKLCLTYEWEDIHRLFGVLLCRRFACSSLIMYLVTYLRSACIHWYLLYILGCSPVVCYLFCCSNCSSFGHWTLSVYSCVLLAYSSFCFLSFSLLSGTVAYRLTSCILCLRPRISLFSLYWRIVL